MASGFENKLNVRVLVDASACLGVIARRGAGKVGHIDASHLWIQETSAKRRATYEKAVGSNNPADLMTKGVCQVEVGKHLQSVGACCPEGRVEGASKVVIDEVPTVKVL